MGEAAQPKEGHWAATPRAVEVQPPLTPGTFLRSQNLSNLKYPLATAAPVSPDTLGDVQAASEHSVVA